MDIYTFDEITAALAQRVAGQLRAAPTEPVTVWVNSYGGDLAAATAIYNALRAHRGPVAVQVEGVAASAATLLCCIGQVYMAENSALMIHAPWLSITGNARDLRDSAEGLDAMAAGMAAAYRAKTGKPAADIARLLDGCDHWFSAEEALRFGLIDAIIPARRVAARLGPLKPPGNLKMPLEAETPRTVADVASIQDAAAKDALAKEQTRRRDIRALLVGCHAKNPALQDVLNACLDDPDCTPDLASQRLLRKLGESAEPVMGAHYDSGPAGSWAIQPTGFVAPSGPLAREFAAAERAARIGNPTPFGGFGGSEFVRAAADALAVRLGTPPKQVHPAAADFREMGVTGMAAMCLNAAGKPTMGLSRSSVIQAAMTPSASPALS